MDRLWHDEKGWNEREWAESVLRNWDNKGEAKESGQGSGGVLKDRGGLLEREGGGMKRGNIQKVVRMPVEYLEGLSSASKVGDA